MKSPEAMISEVASRWASVSNYFSSELSSSQSLFEIFEKIDDDLDSPKLDYREFLMLGVINWIFCRYLGAEIKKQEEGVRLDVITLKSLSEHFDDHATVESLQPEIKILIDYVNNNLSLSIGELLSKHFGNNTVQA